MRQFYPFPSIDQYRTVVKHVRDRVSHHGMTAFPKIVYHGSVKLHGTNAAVVFTEDGDYYAQSRSQVITPEADNAGFAAFAQEHRQVIQDLAAHLVNSYYDYDARDWIEKRPSTTCVIYGEWCGGNIQKGVAITGLPKMFVVFGVKLVDITINDEEQEQPSFWLMPWDFHASCKAVLPANGQVKCIEDFETYKVVVDFARPEEALNQMVAITAAVENRCPVGHAFGKEGVGEGVVWTPVGFEQPVPVNFRIDDLTFKVKGEKHSDTKVKVTKGVDIERLNSIKELAVALVTDHRLEKGIAYLKEVKHRDDVLYIENIGEFLKWVSTDVHKEDTDVISEHGFDVKDVVKAVAEVAKSWFKNQIVLDSAQK